jgi:hypothetical protein
MNRLLACSIVLCIASHVGLVAAQAQAGPDPSIDTLYEQGQWQISPHWRGLGKTHDTAVFLHNEPRKTADGRVAVWRDREFAFAEYIEKEKAYLSTRERVLVDCKTRRFGISDWSYYAGRFGSGAVIATRRVASADMKEAVPDSLEERIVKIVCAPKSRVATPPKTKAAKG